MIWYLKREFMSNSWIAGPDPAQNGRASSHP